MPRNERQTHALLAAHVERTTRGASIGEHAFRPGPFRAYRKPSLIVRIARAIARWL